MERGMGDPCGGNSMVRAKVQVSGEGVQLG